MKMYHVVGKGDVSNIVKHIKNENQAISIKSAFFWEIRSRNE